MPTPTFFSFTSTQKKGVLTLAILLLLIYGFNELLDQAHLQRKDFQFPNQFVESTFTYEPPKIDINISSPEEWERLKGIGPVLSKRIVKYRHSINGFTSLEDVRKVYGISDSLFATISPFLYIDPEYIPMRSENISSKYSDHTDIFTISYDSIRINAADTMDWQKLPGIGPVLSKRIVKFRTMKKGFTSISDLEHVYGLKEETFQTIKPYLILDSIPVKEQTFASRNTHIKEDTNLYTSSRTHISNSAYTTISQPININSADSVELLLLPGVNPSLAGRIISYRSIIGFFAKPEYLTEVYGMSHQKFNKMKSNIIVGDISTFPKLDLNMVPEWKFKFYPFLSEENAQKLLQFRHQIKRIDTWEELEKIPGWDPILIQELQFYFDL